MDDMLLLEILVAHSQLRRVTGLCCSFSDGKVWPCFVLIPNKIRDGESQSKHLESIMGTKSIKCKISSHPIRYTPLPNKKRAKYINTRGRPVSRKVMSGNIASLTRMTD